MFVARHFIAVGGSNFVHNICGNCHGKAAAKPDAAVDTDVSANLLYKLLADGEAKARAAKTVHHGIIGLLEWFENSADCVLRYADAGIRNRKPYFGRFALRVYPAADRDSACLGKLDGIAGKVQQDIADDFRRCIDQLVAQRFGRYL